MDDNGDSIILMEDEDEQIANASDSCSTKSMEVVVPQTKYQTKSKKSSSKKSSKKRREDLEEYHYENTIDEDEFSNHSASSRDFPTAIRSDDENEIDDFESDEEEHEIEEDEEEEQENEVQEIEGVMTMKVRQNFDRENPLFKVGLSCQKKHKSSLIRLRNSKNAAQVCPPHVFFKRREEQPWFDCASSSVKCGYSMVRATHGVNQPGLWYFEVVIGHSVSKHHSNKQSEEIKNYSPHWRIGWSRENADLRVPVGFDKLSYAYRDGNGDKFHESKGETYGESFSIGDVIGCLLFLPKLSEEEMQDEIAQKEEMFQAGFQSCKLIYLTRQEKKYPGSKLMFFKNGKCQGLAFENLWKGMYYPAVSLYWDAECSVNFGSEFHYVPQLPSTELFLQNTNPNLIEENGILLKELKPLSSLGSSDEHFGRVPPTVQNAKQSKRGKKQTKIFPKKPPKSQSQQQQAESSTNTEQIQPKSTSFTSAANNTNNTSINPTPKKRGPKSKKSKLAEMKQEVDISLKMRQQAIIQEQQRLEIQQQQYQIQDLRPEPPLKRKKMLVKTEEDPMVSTPISIESNNSSNPPIFDSKNQDTETHTTTPFMENSSVFSKTSDSTTPQIINNRISSSPSKQSILDLLSFNQNAPTHAIQPVSISLPQPSESSHQITIPQQMFPSNLSNEAKQVQFNYNSQGTEEQNMFSTNSSLSSADKMSIKNILN